MNRLFVYGTLRPAGRAWCRVEPHCLAHAPATVAAVMVRLPGNYPAIALTPADDRQVLGELLELREVSSVLVRLDAYEGDEYRRVIAEVSLANGARLPAWIYVARDAEVLARGTSVPTGNWLDHES